MQLWVVGLRWCSFKAVIWDVPQEVVAVGCWDPSALSPTQNNFPFPWEVFLSFCCCWKKKGLNEECEAPVM